MGFKFCVAVGRNRSFRQKELVSLVPSSTPSPDNYGCAVDDTTAARRPKENSKRDCRACFKA